MPERHDDEFGVGDAAEDVPPDESGRGGVRAGSAALDTPDEHEPVAGRAVGERRRRTGRRRRCGQQQDGQQDGRCQPAEAAAGAPLAGGCAAGTRTHERRRRSGAGDEERREARIDQSIAVPESGERAGECDDGEPRCVVRLRSARVTARGMT